MCDPSLMFFVRSTWQRVSAVRLFIEHTCPGTLVCHPADIKNVFKLWKVGAAITSVDNRYATGSVGVKVYNGFILMLTAFFTAIVNSQKGPKTKFIL